LSDVCSLPFFLDVLAVTRAAEGSKSGRKKEHTAPKMCFKLGSDCSIQTIHGAKNGKYAKTTKPSAEPGVGTQASTAAPATGNQPVIELDQTNSSSSKDESDGESGDESSSRSSSSSASSDEDRQASVMKIGKLANRLAADIVRSSPPLPPLGGRQVLRHQVVNVRWRVPFDTNRTSKVHVVFRNLCDTTRRIQLIDEFGTWGCIKQWG
jgi:hypothetical protein